MVEHCNDPEAKTAPCVASLHQGFYPFEKDDTVTSVSTERINVIFGTSITERVNGDIMSRGSTRVINLSESGNKIGDIIDSVRNFSIENPGISANVKKIIFCIGINDIRFLIALNMTFLDPLDDL